MHTLNFTLYLLLYAVRIGFMQNVANLSEIKDDSAEAKLMYTKEMFQSSIAIIIESFFFFYM